ncbi:hypothetical protein ARAM_002143 [Aspergillus rambellii]|uniref:NAD(P)-binding domain-containing protein n=1 Tax=Aspergillus rambellii TaxID=308745 RepID=A0A0F8XHX9_9EURO|nr:hypothetical protein ARAM_002143 [Aspergillus rambellii]
MASYAVLGSTGNTGTALIENILRVPTNRVHAYCRNKAKLLRLVPEIAENKSVDVFEGNITDLDLMVKCVRGTRAVFLVATTNDNVPGCRISQDSVQTVIDALKTIRDESDSDIPIPKLVLLSSATIDLHLSRRMPGWFKPVMKMAASNVYNDLIEAENMMREQQDWLQSIFIKPGGLSVDIQRGHKLDFDEQESFISYLDLAAAMLEAANDPNGKYDMKNVGVVNTGGIDPMSETIMGASQIRLQGDKLGENLYVNPPQEAIELTNRLLQRNHDELHIFFRDLNGHNHLVHNLLTRLVLGATPAQIQVAFDDDLPTQRAMPPLDEEVVQRLSNESYFYERISKINHYTNFLFFFQKQISRRGWKAVVNEYLFSRSRIAEALLALMYEGAYHPIIHLGLGIEFEQPSIIAEALAQAAAHDSFGTSHYFSSAEERATVHETGSMPLAELLHDISNTPSLVSVGRAQGLIGTMKMKRAVLPDAGEDIIDIAARFRVTPETLEKRTAEVINLGAYMAGSAQRTGYARKIDFFFMHCVTSSIFLSVLTRQDWIRLEDRARVVEWKGRLDLIWYVICGLPELDIHAVENYTGTTSGAAAGWMELFALVNEQHDDGHVAKFVRALKNGEEVCREFEDDDDFMVQGDMWLKIARMAYDSTQNTTPQTSWVVMAGMNDAWAPVPKQ